MTQNYVVGAISGTATIAAAIVAFVMLVSLSTLQDWPISGLGLPFGNGDSGGATRAPESRTPAPKRTAAIAPSTSLGATRAARVAAGTERHGHAGVGGGSAIAGSGNGSGDIATGAPTASPPSSDPAPPSDDGSAAPVESTGEGGGSGSAGGAGVEAGPVSRSARGVDEFLPGEGEGEVALPPIVTPQPAGCDEADSDDTEAISEEADCDEEGGSEEESSSDEEGGSEEADCEEALLDGRLSVDCFENFK